MKESDCDSICGFGGRANRVKGSAVVAWEGKRSTVDYKRARGNFRGVKVF